MLEQLDMWKYLRYAISIIYTSIRKCIDSIMHCVCTEKIQFWNNIYMFTTCGNVSFYHVPTTVALRTRAITATQCVSRYLWYIAKKWDGLIVRIVTKNYVGSVKFFENIFIFIDRFLFWKRKNRESSIGERSTRISGWTSMTVKKQKFPWQCKRQKRRADVSYWRVSV